VRGRGRGCGRERNWEDNSVGIGDDAWMNEIEGSEARSGLARHGLAQLGSAFGPNLKKLMGSQLSASFTVRICGVCPTIFSGW
jgi:hypothetical protein